MNAPNASGQILDRPGLTPEARRVVVVVLVGAILAFLDATVVNVSLKSLSTDLGGSLDTVQWVVTGYLLAQAAVLPATGWAVRRAGAKRLYIAALLTFVLASAACAAANSIEMLIAARVLQGLGAGVMVPAGQILMVTTAGKQGMARAMVAAGIPMMLTPVIGPTIGGLLLEYAGWQWIFLINLPIGALGLILAWRLLPRTARDELSGALDLVGLTLVVLGMIGLTYGLSEAADHGLNQPGVLVPLCGGIALTAAFIAHSLRVPHPLLDLRLWRDRFFALGAVTTAALGTVTFGAMILLPLYFQLIRHLDAAHTGMLMAPQGIGAAAALALSAPIYEKIGPLVCVVGGLLCCAATIPFLFLAADTPYWALGSAMVVRGLGIGLAAMPAMTVAMRDLSPGQIVDATPQLHVLQRIGGSVGTAVFVVVLQQHLVGGGVRGFDVSFSWVLGASVLAVVPAAGMGVLWWRRT